MLNFCGFVFCAHSVHRLGYNTDVTSIPWCNVSFRAKSACMARPKSQRKRRYD